MSGKKPSWLLRAGSFLLAALMVFGNLCLPNGFLKASAEETESVLFSTDFEDYTVGNSPRAKSNLWRIYKSATEVTDAVGVDEVTIAEINGNKLLRVSNEADVKVSANYAFSASHLNDVTISYYVAVVKPGSFVFPSPAAYASEGNEQLFVGTYGNYTNLMAKSASAWEELTVTEDGSKIRIEAAKWHQVKIHYTTTGCTVYIDGKLTSASARGTSGVKLISMVANTGKSGVMYIDNIKVTAADHAPLAAPTTALTVDTVVFEETFDNLPITTSENIGAAASWPAAWYFSKKDIAVGYCISADPDASTADNKVLKIPLANGAIEARSRVGHAPSMKKAVLEYRFYPTDDVIYMPSLSSGNQNNVTKNRIVNLIYFPDESYMVDRDAAGTDHDIAFNITKEAWHTVKLVVDTEENIFYV